MVENVLMRMLIVYVNGIVDVTSGQALVAGECATELDCYRHMMEPQLARV